MRALGAALTRWPVLGAGVVYLLWGLVARDEQRSTSAVQAIALPTAPEAILAHLDDPYPLTFVVPVHLALACASMTASADSPVLARARTSARWLWWSLRAGAASASGFVAAMGLAAVVAALGLSWSPGPISPAAMAHSQVLGVLATQRGGQVVPVLALVAAQLVLLGVGLVALRTVLALTFLLTRSLGALAVSAVAVWVTTVFSSMVPWEGAVGPIDALALHESGQHVVWWASAAVPAALIAALLGVAIVLDRAVAPRRATPGRSRATCDALVAWVRARAWRPGMVYAVVVVLAVLAVVPQVAVTATSPWDVLIALGWGTSPQGASPVTLSLFTLVFVGFAYLVCLQLGEQLGDRLPYVMIRHRSTGAWALGLLTRFAAQGAALIIALIALSAGLGHLLLDVTPSASPPGVMTASGAVITMSPPALHQVALNGALQLFAYAGALFLVAWWARSPIWSLGALALITVLHLPGANAGGWIPVGLNSIAMLTSATPTRMSVELAALDAALVLATLVSVTRTTSTTCERS